MDELFAKYGIKSVKSLPVEPPKKRQKNSGPTISAHCRVGDCYDCSGYRKGGKCFHECHGACKCDWQPDINLQDRMGKCLGCGKTVKTPIVNVEKMKKWDDECLF